MTYKPQPIDTSGVRLPPDLAALTEYLAANTHEVWARGRVGEGWTYGERRDDQALTHPDLVPYDRLTDAEKQFDRATATEVLKLILHRGYKILPPAGEADDAPKPAAAELAGIDLKKLSVVQLVHLWRSVDGSGDRDVAPPPPDLYARLAERALKLGEPLLAFDVLKEALKRHPGLVRLRQLQSVALSRSGVAEEATKKLRALLAEGVDDEETRGNLARTLKDRWEAAAAVDPHEKRRLLEQAFEAYETAYRHPKGGYWTGINAATLAACLGRRETAEQLAAEVEAACQAKLDGARDEDAYWELATMGEAALVRRDFAAAEAWFRRAAAAAGDAYGNVGTTRRNAALLLRHYGEDPAALDRWLPMPRVVVFSGHMLDRPMRLFPRFPADLEPAVAAEIRARVEALDVRFAFAGAACGSDILFLEAVAERGGDLTIVLPYQLDRFLRDSVCLVPGSSWEARLRTLLARDRTRLIYASQGELQDVGVSNEYANHFMFGLAGIRAFQLRTELAAMAVWTAGSATASAARRAPSPAGARSASSRW
jgi:hypothetical protein